MPEESRKFQGSSMTLVREAGGAALVVGNVFTAAQQAAPSNKIPIGSWEDTIVMTRTGRRKLGGWTFGIRFNPDNATQVALVACKESGEKVTMALTQSEGTSKIRTWTARVANWGFTGNDDDIINGELTLKDCSIEVRT